jgi:phosphatidate cytidylyltransferase
MRQRVIGAAVLVPVVAVVFLLGNPWLTIGVALLALGAAIETVDLVTRAGLPAIRLVPLVAAPLVVLGALAPEAYWLAGLALVAVIVGVAAFASFGDADLRHGFLAWSGTLFAAVYASLPVFVALIARTAPAVPASAPLSGYLDAGRIWLLVLVLTVWACDTFAYLSGRTYPRGHPFPTLSPNKSWTGVIGGTLAAVIVCAALATILAGVNPLGGALLGLLIAVTAQVADASESLLKRAAGVKDSGSLIPGHGGVLDRIDSFMYAAPTMFLVLTLGSLLLAPAT